MENDDIKMCEVKPYFDTDISFLCVQEIYSFLETKGVPDIKRNIIPCYPVQFIYFLKFKDVIVNLNFIIRRPKYVLIIITVKVNLVIYHSYLVNGQSLPALLSIQFRHNIEFVLPDKPIPLHEALSWLNGSDIGLST